MPFPFSLRGSLVIDAGQYPERSIAVLRSATMRWLNDSRAKKVNETDGAIFFTAGAFRSVWSGNILVPISRGIIEFEHQGPTICVKYHLWFTEMLIVATTMVALFGAPLLAARNLTTLEAVACLIGMWLWLFGGNFVTAWIRVPRALARIVRYAALKQVE